MNGATPSRLRFHHHSLEHFLEGLDQGSRLKPLYLEDIQQDTKHGAKKDDQRERQGQVSDLEILTHVLPANQAQQTHTEYKPAKLRPRHKFCPRSLVTLKESTIKTVQGETNGETNARESSDASEKSQPESVILHRY